MTKMAASDFGTGILETARLLLAGAAVVCLCTCDKAKPGRDAEPQELISRFLALPVEVDEFWNESRIPGHVMRSIGFNHSLGLFFFWEMSDIGANAAKPSCWGSYSKAQGTVELRLPFGLAHGMRFETRDGAECLVPDGMTVEEAQTKGWLLIRRKGASFDDPFGLQGDDLTVFDQP